MNGRSSFKRSFRECTIFRMEAGTFSLRLLRFDLSNSIFDFLEPQRYYYHCHHCDRSACVSPCFVGEFWAFRCGCHIISHGLFPSFTQLFLVLETFLRLQFCRHYFLVCWRWFALLSSFLPCLPLRHPEYCFNQLIKVLIITKWSARRYMRPASWAFVIVQPQTLIYAFLTESVQTCHHNFRLLQNWHTYWTVQTTVYFAFSTVIVSAGFNTLIFGRWISHSVNPSISTVLPAGNCIPLLLSIGIVLVTRSRLSGVMLCISFVSLSRDVCNVPGMIVAHQPLCSAAVVVALLLLLLIICATAATAVAHYLFLSSIFHFLLSN